MKSRMEIVPVAKEPDNGEFRPSEPLACQVTLNRTHTGFDAVFEPSDRRIGRWNRRA